MPTSTRDTLLGRYYYDPLDRLVDCAPFDQEPTQRYYCKTRLATEIQGSVKRTIVQHDDQLLALQQHEGDKTAAWLLATDHQRSVLNALDANQPHPLVYTSYGHRPMENGLLSLLGFNGERPDPVTGHYHLGIGYRQFNPVLMRFNSPDSWSPFGKGGLNAYAYCAGDPVNWNDPTGHFLVRARFFDEIFGNVYKLMKGSSNEQFSKIVLAKEADFGGLKGLKILAENQNSHPDAIIARNLSEYKKFKYLNDPLPIDETTGIAYLHKANRHLLDTLDNINTYQGLLKSKRHLKHLNDTEIRNLQQDLFTHKNELARVVKHVSSFRIEGVSRLAGDFNRTDFVKTAAKIRDSRLSLPASTTLR